MSINVLVACEESQIVCKAFRDRGFKAYSCDVQMPSGGHPEWHILSDVIPLLNGHCSFKTLSGDFVELQNSWDMIIAFPPCTYLSNAGNRHLYSSVPGLVNEDRVRKGVQAALFFNRILLSDCRFIAVENPVPNTLYGLPPYSQVIQPYYFGHPYSKRTCLWLKNLPKLRPTNILDDYSNTSSSDWFQLGGDKLRQVNRSKTFSGVAEAMAKQWGDCVEFNLETDYLYSTLFLTRR